MCEGIRNTVHLSDLETGGQRVVLRNPTASVRSLASYQRYKVAEIAQTLVNLDVDLGEIITTAPLSNEPELAFKTLGLEVRKTEQAPQN